MERAKDIVVSTATIDNWKKLKIVDISDKLQGFANKTKSKKQIIPVELFDDLKNISTINELIDYICKNQISVSNALFSLGLNLLSNSQQLVKFQAEYDYKHDEKLVNWKLPNEFDLLGIVYQSLLTEGEKNQKGSYYTPSNLTRQILKFVKFDSNSKILDPACGSLNFLLNIENIKPEQIYACDVDEFAVMISKIKYYLQFPKTNVEPHIFVGNFLEQSDLFSASDFQENILENHFDFVITNPPWGANHRTHDIRIKSGETFSYFLTKSYDLLAENGKLIYLLPKSILNIKVHSDIREFLLNETNLEQIDLHEGNFTGVMTNYISLVASKNEQLSNLTVSGTEISKTYIRSQENFVISLIDNQDIKILSKFDRLGKNSLEHSDWALGIVTGNNKEKVLTKQIENSEPIYTGKEITAYQLKPATKYIVYDRKQFQQVAKDEYYRASEKLVYKFISKKLQFAYDDQQRLFLNSANLLIPNVPTLSIKSVMAFLNSELFQFVYHKKFDDIKILKGNLLNLKFPTLTEKQNQLLSNLTEILDDEKINDFVYRLYEIDEKEQKYIKGVL